MGNFSRFRIARSAMGASANINLWLFREPMRYANELYMTVLLAVNLPALHFNASDKSVVCGFNKAIAKIVDSL